MKRTLCLLVGLLLMTTSCVADVAFGHIKSY